MRHAVRALLVGVVAIAAGPRPNAAADDRPREVPYLFGLETHWKSRFESRIEPTLLAIDPTRPLPTEERKPGTPPEPPGPRGPWAVPVTDVLEITAKDDFPASLAAFEKRLDDPAAKHDDFVVAHGWIGTGTSDGDHFAPALERVRGSRIVFAWGHRDRYEGGNDKPFHLDYDTHRGGGLGIPFLAVEQADLAAFARDVRVYLRLLAEKRLSEDLWLDVRKIPHEEIRYAAVRDVLDASYGFGQSTVAGQLGGLTDSPLSVREGFARELWAAAGSSPRRRLQAFHFLHWDRSREVTEALLGDDHRWLLELVSGEEPLAEYALGAAASERGVSVARAIGVDMVLAAIERPRGIREGIALHHSILAVAPPVPHVSIDRVRPLLRAITGADGRDWTAWVSKEQAAGLLVALVRVMPEIVTHFAALPAAERDAVRAWLASLRVWAPPLDEPVRKARALFRE